MAQAPVGVSLDSSNTVQVVKKLMQDYSVGTTTSPPGQVAVLTAADGSLQIYNDSPRKGLVRLYRTIVLGFSASFSPWPTLNVGGGGRGSFFHEKGHSMIAASLKLKSVATCFALLFLLTASSASAQVFSSTIQIANYSAPSYIDNPLTGFSINYRLTGYQTGWIGAGVVTVRFYLSDTPSGSNQVYLLGEKFVPLSAGTGQFGPFYAPSGTLTANLSQADMEPAAVALLEDIVTSCAPQNWYILGYAAVTGSLVSAPSSIGGWRQSDQFFMAGALSPSAIQPGGTTNLSFTLYRQCPSAYSPSSVGIYLANANFQLLSYIGSVSTPGYSGVTTLQPTGITFSPSIPLGTYYIVLIADDEGVVPEVNENNNVGSLMLNITSSAQPSLGHDEARLETEVSLSGEPASLVRGLKPGASDAYLHER